METLWLGYDGLDLPFREIVAVLLYQPALDLRITLAFGQGGCKVASGGGLGVAKLPLKDFLAIPQKSPCQTERPARKRAG